MNATINVTGEVVTGKTIQDIRRKLNAMLKVEGPQGLTAITDSGTTIHVELWEGQDYILRAAAALGRKGGSRTSERKAISSAANGRLGGRPKKTK